MANTISPNMGLIVPGVGTEPGPTWANDLNADLGILDQHNHSNGQGVQITTAGLNINTDLPINSNNLTGVRTVNFDSQGSSLPGLTPDLGAIYVAGNELYYNDESGNVVQITNVGSVNAGAGSITGLPSGTASASYSAGSQTFIWQSATNTAANMDNGSVTIREVLAAANGVTIKSPSSLSADYDLTLLTTLPSVTSFVTVDNAGNLGTSSVAALFPVTTANIDNGAVTLPKMAAPNMVVSSSCGAFSFATGSFDPVTNFSISITTSGKPVTISFQYDGLGSGGSDPCYFSSSGSSEYLILRDTSFIVGAYKFFESLGSLQISPGQMNTIDLAPSAGAHTYELKVTGTGSINRAVMVVREL